MKMVAITEGLQIYGLATGYHIGKGISNALDTKICHFDAYIKVTELNPRSPLNIRGS